MFKPISPNQNIQLTLVSPYVSMPENLNTIDFDTDIIEAKFLLKNIAGFIFKTVLSRIKLDFDNTKLAEYINLVSDNYNDNYFHNFQHSINVLQMSYYLIQLDNLIDKLDPIVVFGLLISALTHDIDHPGNSNSYEINSISKYARLYNDMSVLENHHCALAFELMYNIEFEKCFKKEQFRKFRNTVISCILGTDMSKHNELIMSFKNLDLKNIDKFNIDEQNAIVKIILHFADLSNSIKPFDISFNWSKKISLEYYYQAQKEELEGLPVLSFMKLYDDLTMCLNEITFIKNITLPMWKLFSEKFENNLFQERVEITLKKWLEKQTQIEKENCIDNLTF
jgi:hypothetical protein